jgi:hypothetical protein
MPFHPRVALIFDFDKTLAPDSLDTLIGCCGLDPKEFRKKCVEPLKKEGWDEILAQFYAFIQASKSGASRRITKEVFEEVGRSLELYPGVPELFDKVRGYARAVLPEVEVEFYVVTCGLIQMHRAHPIAKEFNGMWGSEFHFGENGEIEFAKQIITFPEKVHYMLALSKGIDMRGSNEPDAYRPVQDEDRHVPISQILYIGDGASDMPAFMLMNQEGGLAIAVVDGDRTEDWSGYEEVFEERRVQNLALSDYREGTELLQSIQLAVESICKLIALRKLGRGE